MKLAFIKPFPALRQPTSSNRPLAFIASTLLACCVLGAAANGNASNLIKICTDSNFWYPFTFTKGGASSGLHVDIAAHALEKLGYATQFTPLPWKRCLKAAEEGSVDAVVSASFKPKRATFLHYPQDANQSKRSNYRITQVEYVVVTAAADKAGFEYNGNLEDIPKPLRAELGYSIVEDLEAKGLTVQQSPTTPENFHDLVRSKQGSVITLPEIAKFLLQSEKYQGKLILHPTPIKSKSYFLVFSKKSRLPESALQEIWGQIKQTRENDNLMQKWLEQY